MSATGEDFTEVEVPIRKKERVFVRLDDIPDPDGHPDGLKARLKPSSARTLKMTAAWQRDNTRAELLWDIAGSLLPDLSPEQVDLLTADTVLRVMELANQPIAELERIAKNGSAPLAEAPKGSNSVTPSPTRSRGSRKRTASRSTS